MKTMITSEELAYREAEVLSQEFPDMVGAYQLNRLAQRLIESLREAIEERDEARRLLVDCLGQISNPYEVDTFVWERCLNAVDKWRDESASISAETKPPLAQRSRQPDANEQEFEEVWIEPPPDRGFRTIRVKLEYVGRGNPMPVDGGEDE